MSETKTNLYRTKLDVVPRTVAATDKPGRRFQAHLKLRGKLADKELTRRLAEEEFNGNTSEAMKALLSIESFIERHVAEGWQVDLGLASFYPTLSAALTARDVDPESDGVFIQGEVKARDSYRQSMRPRIEPVNALAKRFIRIYNTLDLDTQATDEIVPNHAISVSGHDIIVDTTKSDEGVWLEKRNGRRFHKSKVIQQAEVLESDLITAKIVFRDPIPRGEYNLVVSTRCGDGRDYALRRIGHPVTVP